MQDVHQERRRPEPLDPRVVLVYRKMAEDLADRYVEDFMLPHLGRALKVDDHSESSIAEALDAPWAALNAFFGHYAFSRRGRDREELASIALSAIEQFEGDDALLKAPDGVPLWEEFDKICKDRGRKSNENQNRGLIQGILELAQEVYARGEDSIVNWISDSVQDSHQLEAPFLRLVDIRGAGPKSTSTFLRDVVFFMGTESKLEPAQKIYVQPVDRWLRLVSKYVVPEQSINDAADWVIAGKISKYARRAKVSSIRFNMGVTYFGQKLVKEPALFSERLRSFLIDGKEFTDET